MQEIILEFIRMNKGCTKTQVVNYMDPYEGKNIASPATTFKYIKMLVKEKKVFSTTDERNGSIHHLFINEMHVYNQLTVDIKELAEKTSNSINMVEINTKPSLFFKDSSENYMLVKMYFYLFRDIADISNKIKSSKLPQEDKERLYRRLNRVLSYVSGLNNIF